MNTGGEAADQVIRMSLNGAEVALKITGVAAKEVATLLVAILKDNKKSKGRTRLENLIKTVRNAKGTDDGMVDIMVKQEDISRVDRIVDRFKFADVSQSAQIKSDIEKTREAKKQKSEPNLEHPEKSENEKVMEQMFSKPLQKDENASNPKVAKTTNSRPSEPISKPAEGEPIKLPKPSVRKELSDIKAEQAKKSAEVVKDDKSKNKNTKAINHKQPKQKKSKRKER